MRPLIWCRLVMLPVMATEFLAIPLVTMALYVHYHYLVTPPGSQWQWLVTAVAGLAAAVTGVTIVGFVRFISSSLNSVNESMRRLAQGDLAVRARKHSGSLGRASTLVDEFNTLADGLQRSNDQRVFLNAAIAHELRTPVTLLRARLQGLADGILLADASQYESLLAQTEYLTRLIDDLRVLTLAECGHLDLHLRKADLSSEVASVVELYREILLAEGYEPVTNFQHQIVSVDSMRIRQALHALLDNVRRHAVAGQVRIEVKVAGGLTCLSIEDDGPGIDEQCMPHVFNAYYCRQAKRPSIEGGSGLGLAVVAAIARAHGGSAVCLPAASGGTRFEMRWPI